MKEEALKLADELVTTLFEDSRDYMQEASAMIRRLVEELDEKNYRILELTKRYKALTWNDKQGEPVAWKCSAPPCKCDSSNFKQCGYATYTAPRELSDDEVVIPRELAASYLKITEVPRYKRILEDALKKASEK